MSITSKAFGLNQCGEQVTAYTLTNAIGASVTVIDLGAILTSIIVPDKDGQMADVALGFDSAERYAAPHGSMGDTVGRYGNRIGKGRFTLDGQTYQLALNDHGKNSLHGGVENFSKKMWKAEPREEAGIDSVALTCFSPDMEEGFPGNLEAKVTYSWDDDCNLSIRYQAKTDKPTLFNPTNHSYFNLAGHDHGSVADHTVYIDSDCVTDVDDELIPNGRYYAVSQSPLDMREGLLLEDGFAMKDECPITKAVGGYDINFVLRKGCAMGLAACVHHEATGRTMEVLTDQPGVQLYTANTLHVEGAKGGASYGAWGGFCLETQHFPDSPNNPQWPSTVLRPGETFDSTTIYAFRIDDE